MSKRLSNNVRIGQLRRYHIKQGPSMTDIMNVCAEKQSRESVNLCFTVYGEEPITEPYITHYNFTLDHIIDIRDEDTNGYCKVFASVRCKNGKTRKLIFIYNFITQKGELVGVDGEEFDFLAECDQKMLV